MKQLMKERIKRFQDKLLNEFFDVSEKIREQKEIEQNLLDPENAPDIQELLDQNLEEIIQNSETYENVQVMTAKKKEHEEIKRGADELT